MSLRSLALCGPGRPTYRMSMIRPPGARSAVFDQDDLSDGREMGLNERGSGLTMRYVILGALLLTLDLVGPVHSVHAEPRSEAPTFKAECTDLGPVTLPPSGVIPVVVSYMKNSHHP